MKATELRIGNLVYYSDKETTCVITDITITKIYDGVMAAYPIPLTEEWLLKFGFEITQMSGMYLAQLKVNDSLRIVKPYSKYISGNLVLDLRYDVICLNTIKIKHVHELQNLYFALTGEELEIK